MSMGKLWNSDPYRFTKSKLLYGMAALTCAIAFALVLLVRQDIRIGISVFGDLTAFRGIDDMLRIGVQYQKGLGIFLAVLISVFIGQEYAWKTWQHKWIASKSRAHIYLSKAALSAAVSVAIFLLFEAVVLLCSGQAGAMLTGGYAAMMLGGCFLYAALGSVLCMLSMLIRSNIASTVACLGYVLFSESLISLLRTGGSFPEWIAAHTIYGVSTALFAAPVSILPVLCNAIAIMALSTTTGLLLFRKYEL
jgi:ABC-type transport system involved in multi-copper enzyme maturation permease subunit